MSVTPESVAALMESENWGDRQQGLHQCRQLPPDVALEFVIKGVGDSNARVRYAAVSQLASLGQQDRPRVLPLLRDRLLTDKEADVRAAAADTLGALQLHEAFDDLALVFRSSSEWILQMSIVAALGAFGDPRGFELLKEALQSPEDLVRTLALSALGELGNPEAIPILLEQANSDDWQVRFRVAQALTYFRDHPEVRAVLDKLAQDKSEAVARAATAV
jgi:HEAT repeat protein